MGKDIGVYFESWASKWVSNAGDMDLAQIEKPVTIVNLSFLKPNTSYYPGQRSLAGTGLEFSQDFNVVVEAIAILRSKGIKVLISVGGATYPFNGYNAPACAALCVDLGCDGIDIDWEPSGGSDSDEEFGPIIDAYSKALGTSKFLSTAGFSTGAYDKTGNGGYQGMNIKGLTTNGSQLHWINIMAYDAGPLPDYDPVAALHAYRVYYPGPLVLGMEVGSQGWGGALLTEEDVVRSTTGALEESTQNGVFVWSYLKNPTNTPTPQRVIEISAEVFNSAPPTTPPPTPTPTPCPDGFLTCPNCFKQFNITLS